MPSKSLLITSIALASAALMLPAAAAASELAPTKCTIKGTSKADVLRGTKKHDVICAGGGNDRIKGLGGDDYVDGGSGKDAIDGGSGNDTLDGGAANDGITGGKGNDTELGNAGNDRLFGDDGNDDLYGDEGNDTFDGGNGDNFISGGPGTNAGVPLGADAPDCPTSRDRVCHISIHLDIIIPCPSYGFPVGACIGDTPTANVSWASYKVDLPALFATFKWLPLGGSAKMLTYQTNLIPTSWIEGTVPADNSDRFNVRNAWTISSSARFVAPDDPSKRAGEVGGPLHLNFVNGRVGADVYIDGYLLS